MRYVRIFFLYFQEAFVERGRSFIWFLITLLNPLLYFTFWYAALDGGKRTIAGFGLDSIAPYYFLLIIGGSLLQSHIEENIGYWHIYQGGLTGRLLRPISYYWINFISEIPWRIIQGFFGIVVFFILQMVFGDFIRFTIDPLTIFFTICICILAYTVSYAVKAVVGISAFWLTGYFGLAEAIGMIQLVTGGFVVPLFLTPHWFQNICYALPFSYIMYFPVVAAQGRLSYMELIQVMSVQIVWIFLFYGLFQILWKKGSREYVGVSQ